MYLYIMRHGMTDWNRLGRIQGASDIPLNEEGIRIASLTAKAMHREGLSFDRIYTSPYMRAHKTAQIIAGTCAAPVIDDTRLREMGFGAYEGCDYERLKQTDANIRNCFCAPELYVPDPEGESYAQLLERVSDFLHHELIPLESQGDIHTVLVVCHGAVIRAFLSVIRQQPLSEFWTSSQKNCSVNLLEIKDGKTGILKEQILYYDE